MKKIRIGLDFDGVVAYNPARIIRAPLTWIKRVLFKKRDLKFFIPKNEFEKQFWTIVHKSSLWPAKGCDLLKLMAKEESIEFHLVTARFGFLEQDLLDWLKKNDLLKVFETININTQSNQPHIYKEKVINEKRFDYYIEDNLDIVLYLNKKVSTKIYWIYNILDRFYPYGDKFMDLDVSLKRIKESEKM